MKLILKTKNHSVLSEQYSENAQTGIVLFPEGDIVYLIFTDLQALKDRLETKNSLVPYKEGNKISSEKFSSILKHNTARTDDPKYPDKSIIMGGIRLKKDTSENCLNTYTVVISVRQQDIDYKGIGAHMYLYGMAYAAKENYGIKAHRRSVSSGAEKIWDYLYTNQKSLNIKTSKLINCLGPKQFIEDSPINYAYYSNNKLSDLNSRITITDNILKKYFNDITEIKKIFSDKLEDLFKLHYR